MKKPIILLFTILIVACSESDMNGYTDSIIKEANTSNLDNLFLKKSSATEELNQSLKANLLSLDEEELRDMLMKTYPLPNEQGLQNTATAPMDEASSSSITESSSSSEIHYSETHPTPHNPYSGVIKPFIMTENVPYITKGKDHKYGFDGLTKNCYTDKNIQKNCYLEVEKGTEKKTKEKQLAIYISVKKWETVYISPHNFKDLKKARIIQEKKYEDDNGDLKLVDVYQNTDLRDVVDKTTDEDKQLITKGRDKEQVLIKINSLADAGIYGIYTPATKEDKATNNNQLKSNKTGSNWVRRLFIKIIPYEGRTKHITFVALNGDKGDKLDPETETCDMGSSDRGITKACLIKNFNEVYNEAVMDVDVKQELAKDYGFNDMINIWMTDPYETMVNGYLKMNRAANDIIKKEKNGKGIYLTKNKDSNGNDEFTINKNTLEDHHWHILFAINKARKIWELGKCKDSKFYDLMSCRPCKTNEFDCSKLNLIKTSKEKDNVQYYLGKIINHGRGTKAIDENIKIPAKIRLFQTKENGKYKAHYFIFKDNENIPFHFGTDDVLFVEDGFPVVPHTKVLKGKLGAFNEPFDVKIKNHDDYLSYGGISYVPGIPEKKSAYYTLLHELGHSFGLTDVSSTDIYKPIQEIDEESDYFHFIDNETQTDYVSKSFYHNSYASSETNLMVWDIPSGSKLRYRETQIVCTEGATYYKQLNKYGNFDELHTHGVLEAKIPEGFEPNQWECIRGKCYDSKYSETYSNYGRKEYFKDHRSETGPCYENTKPTGNKSNGKNHLVQPTEYKRILGEINENRYLD